MLAKGRFIFIYLSAAMICYIATQEYILVRDERLKMCGRQSVETSNLQYLQQIDVFIFRTSHEIKINIFRQDLLFYKIK